METLVSVAPQEKFKVFVTSDNGFALEAIKSADCDYELTDEKCRDADIFVGVMNFEEDENLALFKKRVWQLLLDEKRRLTISLQTPVVFAYTGITSSFPQKCHRTVENLNAFGRELGVNLFVVTHSLQDHSEEGKDELTVKLKEIIFSQQQQLLAIRQEKQAQQKAKEEDAAKRSNPLVVLPGQGAGGNNNNAASAVRKKVFIAPNDLSDANKQKIGDLVTADNGIVVEDQDDVDIIVVACDVNKGAKKAGQFLQEKCEELEHTQKDVIFTVVNDAYAIAEGVEATKLSGAQQTAKAISPKLADMLKERKNLQQHSQICSTLLNYYSGQIEFEKALANSQEKKSGVSKAALAPAPVAQHASFFNYPEKRTCRHSRQTRFKYAEENLVVIDSDLEQVKQKKHVLLFAHYMSLRHTIFNIADIKGMLTSEFEDKLAKVLMPNGYQDYKDNQKNDRIKRGCKAKDRVAKRLKSLLKTTYSEDKFINDALLDGLIKLLECADSLERGFFNSDKKQTQIKNIMKAAENVYEFRAQLQNAPAVDNLPKDAQRIYDNLTRVVPQQDL